MIAPGYVDAEYAAIAERARIAERVDRELAMRSAGRADADVAAVLARYDAIHPSWLLPRVALPAPRYAPSVARKHDRVALAVSAITPRPSGVSHLAVTAALTL